MSSSPVIEPARALRRGPRLGIFAAFLLVACGYDSGSRWLSQGSSAPACTLGGLRCAPELEHCVDKGQGAQWTLADDCGSRGLICSSTLQACVKCEPNRRSCSGQTIMQCDETGDDQTALDTCDPGERQVCREGSCVNLCSLASQRRSNVGCEYFAVDLDNAKINDTLNAASQQFAVVISNPETDIATEVTIEQDDSEPGAKNAPKSVVTATIPPFNLRVFRLGPREVDGSGPGEFDSGTHTALSRHAYRIRSTFPVVAYQFNPLENVNVFSNDASLLKPTEALTPLGNDLEPAYVVLGWPQTIANSSDPDTNFSPQNPVSLRAFLTLVGTTPNTHVRVDSNARILPGGKIPATPKGGRLDFELGAFDVLNLETGDFNADFTGSLISSDAPLVVFSGSEASDSPSFDKLVDRKCCADHLEEQLDPIRTSGQNFVATVSPSRTAALAKAGAPVGEAEQSEYFRVIATTEAGARVTTSLNGEFQSFQLRSRGSFVTIASSHHFTLKSDSPVMLSSVSPSQQDANVPTGFPGGDPSLIIVPPLEQFRNSYVFLTPDKYSFDFIRIVAPRAAVVVLDGRSVDEIEGCVARDADGISDGARRKLVGPSPFLVYECQLSFPIIDPNKVAPANLSPGAQNDGVHRVESNQKVGVLVDGFDSYVSYGYAAGTELQFIVLR
ncbi:MAG TPA: IgGFc-binding protein [Polyangiaceae bacterium]|nr:IgGFc-binding protein [Polyangiaceae bacterium]